MKAPAILGGKWYPWFVSLNAALGGFLFGYEIGIISSVLEMYPFRLFFGLSTWDAEKGRLGATSLDGTHRVSQIVSFFLLGCIPGALFIAFAADRLGRRRSIWAGSVPFTLGAILQALVPDALSVNGRVAMMVVGRFLTGIGIGILSMAVPLYIAELASANIRGRLTSVQQLMITIGITFAASTNAIIIDIYRNVPFDNDIQWRIALGIQAAPGILLCISLFFLPESPRWLMATDCEAQALATIAKLHEAPERSSLVQEAFFDMKLAIESERAAGNATWSELMRPGIRNRLAIGVILQFFQQWTGINAVMYFSASLFIAMGFPRSSAVTANVVIQALVNVLFTLPGMFLIERVGRRKLLIGGALGMALCMWLLCVAVNVFQNISGFHSTEIPDDAVIVDAAKPWSVVGMVALYSYVACFAATWGPVVWVYQSEIFPMRVRGKGTGLSTMSNWINNYLLSAVWPYASRHLLANQYAVFGMTGLVMAAYVHFQVPETMGKSLEEMDAVFGFAGPAGYKGEEIELKA